MPHFYRDFVVRDDDDDEFSFRDHEDCILMYDVGGQAVLTLTMEDALALSKFLSDWAKSQQ